MGPACWAQISKIFFYKWHYINKIKDNTIREFGASNPNINMSTKWKIKPKIWSGQKKWSYPIIFLTQ
jgi:hypothetical protein